jgi:hypothetical protein
MMMATSTPTGSVVMGVARDAGGKVLQAAAAHTAETTASISGFSADGVSMASTGAAPGSAGAGSSSTAQSAGGIGTKTLVIVGGVVGAGALVAVAAGGGGGDSGSSGSSGSGGGGGSGGGSTTPGGGTTAATLTGHWVGTSANGGGMTGMLSGQGLSCTYNWDVSSDFVQSGSSFNGTVTAVARGVSCSVPLPPEVTAVFNGTAGSAPVSGTANAGSFAFQAETLAFTGTYTASQLQATATLPIEGFTLTYVMRQTKQQ